MSTGTLALRVSDLRPSQGVLGLVNDAFNLVFDFSHLLLHLTGPAVGSSLSLKFFVADCRADKLLGFSFDLITSCSHSHSPFIVGCCRTSTYIGQHLRAFVIGKRPTLIDPRSALRRHVSGGRPG